MAQTVKNLPTMQETQVQFLGWEDPLQKGMTTWLDKSVPSAVAVSKAASFRKIWGVPTSVTETSRMEGGVGKKIFFVCGFRLVR